LEPSFGHGFEKRDGTPTHSIADQYEIVSLTHGIFILARIRGGLQTPPRYSTPSDPIVRTGNVNSLAIVARNRRYIPGAVVSANRLVTPAIAFSRAQGAYLWDADGNRYIDYHAAFAPFLLGHNRPEISDAVVHTLSSGVSLFGVGSSRLEGDLAELLCESVPHLERVTLLNTGSEAVATALRVARAATGRKHFIKIQGGYDGNSDELACNTADPIASIGPRVSPGEYPCRPIGAGTVLEESRYSHAINFNDLDSVRWVCERYEIAAMVIEPVLQNIGVVPPSPGYLQGLRELADKYNFLLVFDEVKTGFRHGLGGWAQVSGVVPDLAVYGKAVANGFPIAVVGGKAEWMELLCHEQQAKRPFIAGTYNGHPVGVSAAIATIQLLKHSKPNVYSHVNALGATLEAGMVEIFQRRGVGAVVSRVNSAFSIYFMDRLPRDWHDIAEHHDAEQDLKFRRALIERGVYAVPVATKQYSISASHSKDDISFTLEQVDAAAASL
jgi:glutamate-1-semialdehyde 2,1-aminomutase